MKDLAVPSGPLGYGGFRLLWASSLCSWFSQWTQQAALGWVVYDITGSGALLGAVLGVRAIPILLLTPLSGLAADRWDRRRLLQWSQLFACVVALAMAGVLWWGAAGPALLFGFTVLMGASNVMDRPARMTAAFELVPQELRMKAVALNTTSFSMMRIVAPAFAGYLIAAFGAAGCFLVQAVLYLASSLVVGRGTFPGRAAPPQGGAQEVPHKGSLFGGFAFALRDRQVRALLLLGALPFLLLVPVWGTLLPIFAKDAFAGGPRELGWMLTAVGAGGTAGGLAAGWAARHERQGVLQVAWIVTMCLAIFGLAASASLSWALVCVALAGAAEMALYASNSASVQMSAPASVRGRISSLLMLNPSLIALGAFLAGPLAQAVGVRSAAFILAGSALAAVLLMAALSPAIRQFRVK